MRGICRRKRSPEGATTFQSSPPHLARARIGKAGLRRLFEALCGLGAQGSPNYFNLSCIITRLRKSGCPCDGSAKHLRTASHLVGEMLLAFKWTTRASCRNVVFSGPCEGSQSRRLAQRSSGPHGTRYPARAGRRLGPTRFLDTSRHGQPGQRRRRRPPREPTARCARNLTSIFRRTFALQGGAISPHHTELHPPSLRLPGADRGALL